jgi:hypothetical protein
MPSFEELMPRFEKFFHAWKKEYMLENNMTQHRIQHTEFINNCNKEKLMEIINIVRSAMFNDYKQSTDSEILEALINGDIIIALNGSIISGFIQAIRSPYANVKCHRLTEVQNTCTVARPVDGHNVAEEHGD